MKKKSLPIITLLSDFSQNDHFVGVMRGVILNINPEVKIVDICHKVQPQDVEEGAYLLLVSFSYFPKGTIHIVVIDPGVGSSRKIILVQTKNYLFLAPDNKVLSWVLEKEKPLKIIEVKNKKYFLKKISSTFHGRDIFAPVGGYLSKGIKPEEFGDEIKDIKWLKFPPVLKNKNRWEGEIIHIDTFGNLITNITCADADKIKRIKFRNTIINKISSSYSEVKKGEILVLRGSSGFLEISQNLGSAQTLFRARRGDKVVGILE